MSNKTIVISIVSLCIVISVIMYISITVSAKRQLDQSIQSLQTEIAFMDGKYYQLILEQKALHIKLTQQQQHYDSLISILSKKHFSVAELNDGFNKWLNSKR